RHDVAFDQRQAEQPLERERAFAAKQVGQRHQRRREKPQLADVVADRLADLALLQGERHPGLARPSGKARPALANSQSRDSLASRRARSTIAWSMSRPPNLTGLPATSTASMLPVSAAITTAPTASLSGKWLSRRASSRSTSAALPGVRLPISFSS